MAFPSWPLAEELAMDVLAQSGDFAHAAIDETAHFRQ